MQRHSTSICLLKILPNTHETTTHTRTRLMLQTTKTYSTPTQPLDHHTRGEPKRKSQSRKGEKVSRERKKMNQQTASAHKKQNINRGVEIERSLPFRRRRTEDRRADRDSTTKIEPENDSRNLGRKKIEPKTETIVPLFSRCIVYSKFFSSNSP
uniref:Putative ovule protein n=1 Tax=Solanum chacoense TaxID=4108 RepID=A0A0V0HQL3_SOLCH